MTYTLTVRNNGPSIATAVSVSDPTPAGVTFVANAGDCTTAFPCALGDLLPTETRTITTTFVVPVGYNSPDVTNTASVTTTTPDPVSTNNTSTAMTPVDISAGGGRVALQLRGWPPVERRRRHARHAAAVT